MQYNKQYELHFSYYSRHPDKGLVILFAFSNDQWFDADMAHWLPLHGHPLQSISLQLNGHKLFENKSSSLQNLSNITASDTYANPLNLQFITKSFQYNSFWYLCQSINLQFITKCFQYNESSLYDRLLLSTFDSKNKWTDNHHIAN